VDALVSGFEVLGFDEAAGFDEVFRALVLACIIEPTSKLDSLRVLEEVGVDPPAYRTPGPSVAGVRRSVVAQEVRGGVCCPYRPGAGEPGAQRRFDVLLRG
jgi:hypothetical protein